MCDYRLYFCESGPTRRYFQMAKPPRNCRTHPQAIAWAAEQVGARPAELWCADHSLIGSFNLDQAAA